jgi:hypothetical protein
MDSISNTKLIVLSILTAVWFSWLSGQLPRLWSASRLRQNHHTSTEPMRSTRQSQGDPLVQVYCPEDKSKVNIDVIAIHGLDTKSPDTWIYRGKDTNQRDVNWLADEDMLPQTLHQQARIFYCDWPAVLFEESASIPKTITELARLLLAGIRNMRHGQAAHGETPVERPILFIASCLGGVILMETLLEAAKDERLGSIQRTPRGVVFLATPFRGTAFEELATWAVPMLKTWASLNDRTVTTLLDSVQGTTFDQGERVRRFTELCKDQDRPCRIRIFYEGQATILPRKYLPALVFSVWPKFFLGKARAVSVRI